MKMIRALAIPFSAAVFSLSLSAQTERHIHVNEEHLDEDEIVIMDWLTKQALPDGSYWLNTLTGAWGTEGNEEPVGVIDLVALSEQVQQYQSVTQGRATINQSQNGSVVSGNINGKRCTFASAGGTTFKVCD